MRDTDLDQRIWGLEKPWFVKRVDLQVVESRVDILLEHAPGVKFPCPKCGRELPFGITPKREPGGMWTPANFRRICMPGFPGLIVPSTGCCKWQSPGRRPGRALPFSWSAS